MMFGSLADEPGLLYVAATLIPLASFVVILLTGGLKNVARSNKDTGWGQSLYWLLGGDHVGRTGAYLATAAIGLSCLLSVTGLVKFLAAHPVHAHHADAHDDKHHEEQADPPKKDAHAGHAHGKFAGNPAPSAEWKGRMTWASFGDATAPGGKLELGYRIDHLGAIMFAMVTFIATLIHIFALGYMGDEAAETTEDHSVHGEDGGHFKRRGRYNRFFMYFSLFCFSMLNLVLADNLFQVFVSWELVGACSFFLIGFYYERTSATNAANKAFITNRVGDAGFIIGMMILFTSVGTLNFEEIFARLRSPAADSHGAIKTAHEMMRVQPVGTDTKGVETFVWTPSGAGSHVALFPLVKPKGHFHGIGAGDDQETQIEVSPKAELDDYGAMPYWLVVVAGLGVFLGCVGKSAQFPLQVWLPDAMEGPTPVSALVHSATMVAAGVYLVGRCFPLFTPEARLVIAYTGAITLFVAATIAIVATDIKKVLAYSTISQLGFMMLALGIGGWVAGLLHLLTHAFFKALLFLGSGSVIHGCHHEQDMRKMGGLLPKMKITGLTMLVGVLAIAGTPFFSGWYSKDAIIAEALAFVMVNKQHFLLLLLPLCTAAITCFYMLRMWFMTFTGEAKDHHVFDHAHESPRVMTTPLIVLAAFSLFVAWGWPLWDAEASWLGHAVEASMPKSAGSNVEALGHAKAHTVHLLAGGLALGAALLGAAFAYLVYYKRSLDPAETAEQFPGVYKLLVNKWYFDEFYSAAFVRPSLAVAGWFRNFDTRRIDGLIDGSATTVVRVARGFGGFDRGVIDGVANLTARVVHRVGTSLSGVQTGYLRSYVLFLALAAVALFAALTYFVGLAAAK